jgi:hypothetical protein
MGLDLRTGTERFRFGVAAVDTSGDYPLGNEFRGADMLPNGLASGEGLTYDQRALDCIAFETRVDVAGGFTASTALEMYCADPDRAATFGFLFEYTSNAPDAAVDIRRGSFGSGPAARLYLPYTSRRQVRGPT